MLETYHLQHFPSHISYVHTALYTGVSDSAALKRRLITASTAEGENGEREREEVNFAFIEARLITSREHLRAAVYHALLAEAQGTLRTKTVHSEIIWILNSTHNITEAMRRYGVGDKSSALVVVRVSGPEFSSDSVGKAMDGVVQGNRVSFDQLDAVTDWAAVKKYHKLSNEAAIRDSQGPEQEHAAIDSILVTTAAMKSVAA